MQGAHPLINPNAAPSLDMDGNSIGYSEGHAHIDATPLFLLGVVLASAATLALLKQAGFKFVIGVGG